MLISLIVKDHGLELDWRCSLLKSRGQVHILGDDASVEQGDHSFVDVLLVDWGRVREVLLVFDKSLQLIFSLLACLDDASEVLFGLVWSIFVFVGGCGFQDASTLRFKVVVRWQQLP